MPSRWKKSNGVVWEELDGRAVLVSTRSRQTFVLNETASYIWKCCDGRLSADSLALRIARATGHEFRRVKEDIFKLCFQLQRAGLLLGVAESPSAASDVEDCIYSFSGNYTHPLISLQRNGMGFRGRPSSRGFSGPG